MTPRKDAQTQLNTPKHIAHVIDVNLLLNLLQLTSDSLRIVDGFVALRSYTPS